MDPKSLYIKPVGIVHTGVSDPRQMPLQGVPGSIEFLEEFENALLGIERNTHLCIFSWFHEADRNVLRSSPVKINPGGEVLGVFTLRTANRPNPVAFTVARISRVEGRTVFFDRLDMIDGTPVLDIKPYSAGWDSVFSARDHHSAMIPARMGQSEGIAQFIREASNYHGECCRGCMIAASACYDAMKELDCSIRDVRVEAPGSLDGCILDAVIGITKATPGTRRLMLKDSGSLVLKNGAKAVEISFHDSHTACTDAVCSNVDSLYSINVLNV